VYDISKALVGVVLAAAVGLGATASRADELRDRVVDAALETYVHGVTAEIAAERVGAAGVPVLHQLLSDPSFPRRDNVVAFLTYLGDNDSARALHGFLRNPPASPQRPEEDRALLLAPHALGEIAARGYSMALRVLLVSTRNGAKGGVLNAAATRPGAPPSMRDDLLEMAVRGLGKSKRKAAGERLRAIADGRAVPAPGGRRLGKTARAALADIAAARSRSQRPDSTPHDRRQRPKPAAAPALGLDAHPHDLPAAGGGADVDNVMMHDSGLDYVNHAGHNNPMTNAHLDLILADATVRFGRADYGSDISCCVRFHREGTGGTFGAPGDGLDIVDTDTEMYTVLGNQGARVKVVRLINWCGNPGTNFIGCGYIGGYGTAVVRYGDLASEGALWVHEYGHNVGLGHNTSDTRLIMYPVISHNEGLTAAECAQYHAPAAGARADIDTLGQCVLDSLDESVCGNGLVEAGEECDFDELQGASCAGLGFDSGGLRCASDCSLDASACSRCGNGVREGGEECDGADLGGVTCGDHLCRGGTPRCTGGCTLDLTACSQCPACDNDGVCEAGESCGDCPHDCAGGGGAECGNGICEVADGENCLSCAADCNGEQGGERRRNFCCGGGGERPVGCGDARCGSAGFACTMLPAPPSCCGDGQCGGAENDSSCALDCRAPARTACGNGLCESGEDRCSCAADCGAPPGEVCNDGIDNDCDGSVDCADADSCGDATLCVCLPAGADCTRNSSCCSYQCDGPLRAKTCR
jgi:hypothetical protein